MALKITDLELNIKDNANEAAKGIDRLVASMTKLKAVSGTMPESNIGRVEAEIEGINAKVDDLNSKLGETASDTGKVGNSASEVGKQFSFANSKLGKLWATVKRIAMYRAIRTAIKMVTQGISEGIQNLYQYSLIMNTSFAPAMDKYATAFLYLKNSLGAAIAPILESLAPAIDWLVDQLVVVLNVINQIFSALSGKSTYTRAIKYAVQFADATDSAAKSMKKMLFGFDELNVLTDPNSGAAKEMQNYGAMFEEAAIDNPIAKFVLRIKDFSAENWTGMSDYEVSTAIMSAMLGTAGAVIGGLAGGPGGALVGIAIGTILSALIHKASFDKGEVTFAEMFATLPDALPKAFEFETENDVLNGRVWSYLDMPLGNATFSKGNGFLGSNMMDSLTKVLTAATFSAIGFKVGGFVGHPLAGALIGGLVGLAMGMDLTSADFKEGKTGLKQIMENSLISTIAAAGGFALGFALTGSIPGGLMAATLAISLTLLLKNIDWDSKGREFWSGQWFDDFSQDWGAVSPASPKGATSVLELTDEDNWAGDVPRSILHRAGGGSVPNGQLFIAGEAGPEIVSGIGNRTQVTNMDQFSANIASANEGLVNAVYAGVNAIVDAINSQDYGTYLDGELVTRKLNQNLKSMNHYNGQSLVQGAY